MYKDMRSRVRVGNGYSEEFGVGVGVHQGSVLSLLLFIVLEALSREFRTGWSWELLYADHEPRQRSGFQPGNTWAVQPQKMARGLKFWIYEVEGLYYLCSENKGTDQLCSHPEADLSLCFRICKKPFFSRRDSQSLNDQYRAHGGTAGKVEGMEIKDGEEGPADEHGEDKDYGLWH